MRDSDTIFAFSTAPGRAGIAVLRLSGPAAGETLAALAGRLPMARHATLATFHDPRSKTAIDRGLALYFPAPHSLTGEDMAEIHVHGGRAVSAALIDSLGAIAGLRPAEPGEFTRRAFLNGKLDLTEAEGIADLIVAETEAQRRQAMRQLAGEAGRTYEAWRGRLLHIQARVEAEIDFPEEGLPPDLWREIEVAVAALAAEMETALADERRGERLRDGVAIAIIGPPNAGKSSLMNALARREIAITAASAGTTRDVIELALDLEGYPVILADTAGLRAPADPIEAEGIARARARAAASDLKLLVIDASRAGDTMAIREIIDENTIIAANKIDLLGVAGANWADELGAGPALRISVRTGDGLAALEARLLLEVAKRLGGGAALITRTRHRAALEECRAALARFPDADLPELAAEELRGAVGALGRITGRVDIEDLLDVLFREFCIGK